MANVMALCYAEIRRIVVVVAIIGIHLQLLIAIILERNCFWNFATWAGILDLEIPVYDINLYVLKELAMWLERFCSHWKSMKSSVTKN